MDLYDENEHVISSDEYTDDDDDDDALMNDAVRAQDYKMPARNYSERSKLPMIRIDQKQKELSSLIRRNKISVIYKNKSIKWLNNKRQRERYKEHIYLCAKKRSTDENISTTATVSDQNQQQHINTKYGDKKYDKIQIQDVVSIEDDEGDVTNTDNYKGIGENNTLRPVSTLSTSKYSTEAKNIELETEGRKEISNEKTLMLVENKLDSSKELNMFSKKIKEVSEKRLRSPSPLILSGTIENEEKHNEKKFRAESPQFYKSINDMFPKFDKIATNHIDSITNTTLTATEEKIKCLSNEIETLNDILQTKEKEWNRLLHLKMVKEEMFSRLIQKKHVLLLKETHSQKQGKHTLLELKELECYLSETHSNSSEANRNFISIQKLIENRANMNAEDLEREKNNTSRLHSLLVSRNMLHGADTFGNTFALRNGERTSMTISNKNSDIYNHSDGESILSSRGRQGEFKDVKSIIADFRQKNTEMSPRVGKQIKSGEQHAQNHSFSIPLLEKSASRPPYFTKDHQSVFYPMRNSVEEISITPIGRSKKLSSSHDIDFANTMINQKTWAWSIFLSVKTILGPRQTF